MKTLTVRLPDNLAAEIEAESRARKVSKSDIVRDRLTSAKSPPAASLADLADIIGAIDAPADLSANIKRYLKAGYGRKRHR